MAHFIVEADGGSRGNPGPAAYGAVVRDAATGQVLAERAASIGTATNNVAEYHGLIAGLTAVRELDPGATVEARLDSKLVVEQMSGRWQIKHPAMRPLAMQARAILPPDRVRYVWVPRAQNAHADRLANEALDAAARGEAWSSATSTAELHRAPESAPPPQAAAGSELTVEPSPAAPPNVLVGWSTGLGTPTTTLLMRHGSTEHTSARRFSGSTGDDPPLTAEGKAQAQAAAGLLGRGAHVDAIVCSPMRRTRETAEVVAATVDTEVRVVDAWRECDFGEWGGRTFTEVARRWPDALRSWLADPDVAPPGGESLSHVRRRVLDARDELLATYATATVLVVTHVMPITLVVCDALDAPVSGSFRMEVPPASLAEVQWFAGGHASLRRFGALAS